MQLDRTKKIAHEILIVQVCGMEGGIAIAIEG